MGGHDHGPPYKVPPYTEFSSIKGIKQLEELEAALAKKGLCDPWIRNEAWRYHPSFGSKLFRANKTFLRGMPLGLALAVALTMAGAALGGGGGHGHGHGDEKEH